MTPEELKKVLQREPLSKQLRRFASRIGRAIDHQPIELDDLNRIKLPPTHGGVRYFAERNAQGRWNVWQQTGHAQGPEPIVIKLLGPDLPVGEALNLLAEKNPKGMQEQMHMHWHPQHVAARIGHSFPEGLGHKIPVPTGLLPPISKGLLPAASQAPLPPVRKPPKP